MPAPGFPSARFLNSIKSEGRIGPTGITWTGLALVGPILPSDLMELRNLQPISAADKHFLTLFHVAH